VIWVLNWFESEKDYFEDVRIGNNEEHEDEKSGDVLPCYILRSGMIAAGSQNALAAGGHIQRDEYRYYPDRISDTLVIRHNDVLPLREPQESSRQ
jgi:hypothetical protein